MKAISNTISMKVVKRDGDEFPGIEPVQEGEDAVLLCSSGQAVLQVFQHGVGRGRVPFPDDDRGAGFSGCGPAVGGAGGVAHRG